MDMAVGVTFLSLELACLVLVLLAIVRTGFARLGSSVGIARDGFPPGKAVPSWSLPDVEGHWHVTPAGDHWQLLIFANQALASFPDLISGMNHLANSIQELEVLILAQENREDCVVTAQELSLQIPIVPVDSTFYDCFRVRVMPFAFLLDPAGIVRWIGLVNTEAQLVHAWQMSQAAASEDNFPKGGER